ncbi:transcription initiation factor TFIID subunit 12 [Contarinia nasturtii]|uniref:transcription initiation factor TFIID subunit 12 n=1 Tax=Contarinia nasturtii TaxID=265458 RepID=UPI0012D4508F|nr:transcription initiation factor TFIID subunit 12 [Contarinia nasturtii]
MLNCHISSCNVNHIFFLNISEASLSVLEDDMDMENVPVIKSSEMLLSPPDHGQSSAGASTSKAVPNNASTSSTPAASSSSTASDSPPSLLTKPRLQELVREIDPTEQLDDDVEELLLQIADDFVENTVNAACMLAKHRKASKVEVKDVQLYLERNWNMWLPGFGTEELKPYKRAAVTESHKQRLALIRKAIKKY